MFNFECRSNLQTPIGSYQTVVKDMYQWLREYQPNKACQLGRILRLCWQALNGIYR